MVGPIFPFKVHLENYPARRAVRLLRRVVLILAILFTIGAVAGFIFLTLTDQKEIVPRFITFDSKTSSFRLLPHHLMPGKTVRSSRGVLREKFVRDYVLKRETWHSDMARNHHVLCDCLRDEREKKLIEKTRNRTVEPRCSLCLMSSGNVFKDFFEKIYPIRRERSKNNWTQKAVLSGIVLYETIPAERGKGLTFVYKIDYQTKARPWSAYVSVRDLKAPGEYMFQVVDYGILPYSVGY